MDLYLRYLSGSSTIESALTGAGVLNLALPTCTDLYDGEVALIEDLGDFIISGESGGAKFTLSAWNKLLDF